MGNCLCIQFLGCPKKVGPDEGEDEVRDSTKKDTKIGLVECCSQLLNTTSILDGKLRNGDLDHLIPQLVQHYSPRALSDVAEDCKGQRVTIVVTKKELEQLMKCEDEVQLRPVLVESYAGECKKWKPSLPTIPEM